MERIGGNLGQFNLPGNVGCYGISECNCYRICYQDQDISTNGSCELTLGVNEIARSFLALSLYPQPANDKVQITSTDHVAITRVSVTDAQGKIVMNESLTRTENHTLLVDHYRLGVRVASV